MKAYKNIECTIKAPSKIFRIYIPKFQAPNFWDRKSCIKWSYLIIHKQFHQKSLRELMKIILLNVMINKIFHFYNFFFLWILHENDFERSNYLSHAINNQNYDGNEGENCDELFLWLHKNEVNVPSSLN